MNPSDIISVDIEREALANCAYRKVISTTPQMQLVLMSLLPDEEIGLESHIDATQFIRIEKGRCTFQIGSSKDKLKEISGKDGSIFLIPAGYLHNLINIGHEDLKLYTIYSPPQHKPGLIELTKFSLI